MARMASIRRVREIIATTPASENAWDLAWQEGATPWDSGHIQPPLREYMESDDGRCFRSTLSAGSRALVPGCGKGYDAAYFATLGYDTLGQDLSPLAIEKAREWATSAGTPPQALARLSFKVQDFFKFDIPDQGFELVYDYTFFVALPPSLREAWGARMRELVKPGGILITLVYPIDGPRPGGPPYSVDVDMVKEALGSESEWKRTTDVVPKVVSEGHEGRERLVVWERQ